MVIWVLSLEITGVLLLPSSVQNAKVELSNASLIPIRSTLVSVSVSKFIMGADCTGETLFMNYDREIRRAFLTSGISMLLYLI